ncbi:MAG: inositol monophosphatase [Methylophaga sp.]|jgi:myo-inositol-1(or 4)-monophosphatase|nr:inositol monophosphatase [Methylophaga sp.]MEC9314273.1 inositol monophosphatase [Pseudomonadota bacterium]MED5510003.1 inositol monophosphatase [Pseudomonadota bacterium]
MDIDRQQLQSIVREVAQNTLLPLYNNVQREYKKDGSIITRADKAVQLALTERLAGICPEVLLLGEEMSAEQQQALLDSGKPIWCLDPVDGTSNFATGLPFFSISLALIESGEVKAGIVLDPVRDELFAAVRGQGAWLNDIPLQAEETGLQLKRSIAFVDFKRLPKALSSRIVGDKPYGSQRNLGSIALELCWLAAGRGHIYLHGSQHIWDYAAADLILAEAGGYAATLQGDAPFSHSLQPRSTYAAIDQQLFEQWRQYLAEAVE